MGFTAAMTAVILSGERIASCKQWKILVEISQDLPEHRSICVPSIFSTAQWLNVTVNIVI